MLPLPPDFFRRDATDVAPDLLDMAILHADRVWRIREVEAYTQDDPASHSFRGRTPRNEPMFGPPGRWYVYFVYGMHHCLNVVTGEEGDGQAVLLRAAWCEPALTSGPGRLAKALGADRSWNGHPAHIVDLGLARPAYAVTPRIGITKAVDWPRRWVATS